MNFQGSGFTIDVPESVIDCSVYTFSLPEIGETAPNFLLRFEVADAVDMNARREEVLERFRDGFDDVLFTTEDEVNSRGDWEYFTIVLQSGPEEQRQCLKELHLLITQPVPTVYVFSGGAPLDVFPQFESIFDGVVRSFQPNEIQRLN